MLVFYIPMRETDTVFLFNHEMKRKYRISVFLFET